MPFANPPVSGFQMGPAPDWGQFGIEAIRQIQHGTDLMAQSGRERVAQIDKTIAQISGIMKEHSPEGKLAKELKLEALKAQRSMFNEYKAMTPEQRRANFEFKGGALQYRDRYKGIMEGQKFYNNQLRGKILEQKAYGQKGNPTQRYLISESDRFRQAAGGPKSIVTPLSNKMGSTKNIYGDEVTDTSGHVIGDVPLNEPVLTGGEEESSDTSHTSDINDTTDTEEESQDEQDTADEADAQEEE